MQGLITPPTAEGGIAAGWAFHDLQWKKIAPKAFIFGVTDPVMVRARSWASGSKR